ncbi:hypothetical protein [Melissospora conviva]|uniref:hypothetical protein n=1 Tax=Melissospora conviva TaxID=3388432 RepID=UPI003B787C01
MADETKVWAEQTVEVPPRHGFLRGVASVAPRARRRTEQFPVVSPESGRPDWEATQERPHWEATQERPRMPLSYHVARLRQGGEWSAVGALFAFVCWGIWVISLRGSLTTPFFTFVLTLLVAVGLFALARLLGRLVLERHFGRERRTARGAHLAAGFFLVAVGVAYLQQTQWVVDVWNWFAGLF